ncbi:MAG TPA: methanol/ethanol family PQQ-dependent dehydrogenase [Gemmatimonadaceae bacterium]|nr:methanol/ethanol family PQQ-dependent dehydrogenase [Gemmatimonadaceae bacterium]
MVTSRSVRLIGFASVVILLSSSACRRIPTDEQKPAKASSASAPQPSQQSAIADDGQWLMAAKDFANTRFSGLKEITTENVASLKPAWTFSTGVLRGHEGAPLVVGATMYVVTPYPNNLYALDLTQPGAPAKWVYKPKPLTASQGVACCDTVNRGAAYADGKIFYNTLDNHTVAVDAEAGTEVWNTKVGDIAVGETLTMAPIVVKGKVILGNSGGEMGIRGRVTALDASTGAVAWRAFHTGPDADVLIGPNFKPFYPSDRGTDLGVSSWPADMWRTGGASAWGWISYDPELDLIFYGTANPGPWNSDLRPGDNKWSCTVFARRPETGEAVWAYQYNPHDLYDHDSVNEHMVLDLVFKGQMRKLLVHPERNGHMYVLDRQTGEVLSAEPFAFVNSSTGVDLKTGRPVMVTEKKPLTGRVVRDICPAAPGAKDWQPTSYSPQTGLLYIPHQDLCQDVEALDVGYIAGTPYVGANVKMYTGPSGQRGQVQAWDIVNGRQVWKIQENFPVWSGTVVTAGNVLFYGTMEGWFKAVNAKTGALLWQFKTGSGIIGQPITYKGPDGKQYVAVFSGVGGWAGAIVAGNLDSRDPTAALGFVNAMSDLPQHTTKGGTLHVFALP